MPTHQERPEARPTAPSAGPSEGPAQGPSEARHEGRTTPPPLRIAACRSLCSWGPTRSTRSGLRVFACAGCGSQWVRSEAWTPIDSSGEVPGAVAAEAARRGEQSPAR